MTEENKNELPIGQAVGGMVCGICGVVFCYVPIAGLVVSIIGTTLGAKGLQAANRGEARGKGMAIAGLACGIVGLVFSGLYTIAWISLAGFISSFAF